MRGQSCADPKDSSGLGCSGHTCRNWGGGPGQQDRGRGAPVRRSGSWQSYGIECRQFARGLAGRRAEFFWFCSLRSSLVPWSFTPLASRSLDHISEGSAGQTFGDTCPSPTALFAHSGSAKPLAARFHHPLSSRKSLTQARLPVVWVRGGGVKWISAESCLVGEGHWKGAVLGALPSCPVANWHLEMMAA